MAITKGYSQAQSQSVQSENNLLIMCAPASVLSSGKTLSSLTVTDLTAAAFIDVTYEFTESGGWAQSLPQDTISDPRLTSAQTLSRPGKITPALSLQIVYGDKTSILDPLLVENQNYVFVVRWATDHDKDIAAADKFDRWLVQCGVKSPDQPAANGVFTETIVMHPVVPVVRALAVASS